VLRSQSFVDCHNCSEYNLTRCSKQVVLSQRASLYSTVFDVNEGAKKSLSLAALCTTVNDITIMSLCE